MTITCPQCGHANELSASDSAKALRSIPSAKRDGEAARMNGLKGGRPRKDSKKKDSDAA